MKIFFLFHCFFLLYACLRLYVIPTPFIAHSRINITAMKWSSTNWKCKYVVWSFVGQRQEEGEGEEEDDEEDEHEDEDDEEKGGEILSVFPYFERLIMYTNTSSTSCEFGV